MAFSVKVAKDNVKKLVKGMNFIRTSSVLVGIPQTETVRPDGSQVTNAELLFIHTNGSPVNHIPPRPVIEPAIEKDQYRLGNMMKKAAQLAMDGDEEKAVQQLRLVGMRAQNVCRAYFVDPENGWPLNSPAVQARKREKGSDNPRPLIDTGELRKSITYVIERKGRRVM